MRVLHVLNELKPSGAEVMLRAAGIMFANNGIESTILSTGSCLGTYAPRLTNAGYKTLHLQFHKSPCFFYHLYKLLAKGSYNVVHIHTERANFWLALTALLAGTHRVVRTVHSSFAFTGWLAFKRKLQRKLLVHLGIISVSISSSVQEIEKNHFGVETVLIPNWYDSNLYRPPSALERKQAREAFSLNDQDIALVSVGNCAPVKNHIALIEALAMLPLEDRPIYLHAGIEQVGKPERIIAEKHGVADRIRFLGQVDDVQQLLHATDGFVMPSIYEGFSIAALEAISTGLPAILADVPGLRDLKPIFNGLLYSDTSAPSLHEALITLRNDLTIMRDAARNNFNIARERYGLERGVSEYISLYSKV